MKKKFPLLTFIAPVVVPCLAFAANGNFAIQAPSSDSAACQDFIGFATQGVVDPRYVGGDHKAQPPFATDGLLITQDDKPVFEWYDGVVDANTPHVLWSASKDVTVALLARTIQDGYEYQGQKVTLNTPLSLFYPNPPALQQHPEFASMYSQIQLHHLVEMSSGFNWNEFYTENIVGSSFFPMLYLAPRADMANYALSQPMNSTGPGGQWNYSGGNMNILMSILKMIHGDQYDDMPQKLLFGPLGMTGARIERDGSGVFVGSSYVYMTLHDMAQFGKLYLQDGMWNGKRLLPEGWTKDAQTITDSIFQKATTLDYIKSEGTEGRRVLWLNQNVYRDDGEITEQGTGRKILYPQEFPQAPGDMFFAAGHYGQLIIIIPSHHMVIARTGYDESYWDLIQPLVVKALSCLEPGYQPNAVADLTPPSADPQVGFFEGIWDDITSVPPFMSSLSYLSDTGLSSALLAKEMCSFLFVQGAKDKLSPDDYASTYYKRSGLPGALIDIVKFDLEVNIDKDGSSVTVSKYNSAPPSDDPDAPSRIYLNRFTSKLESDPRFGCDLQQIQLPPQSPPGF